MPKAETHTLTVCLIYSHPLALREFRQQLPPSVFNLKALHLHPSRLLESDAVPLPRCHVFVMDSSGPRHVVEVLVADIRESRPHVPIVVVTDAIKEAHALPLLRQGVKGLLTYAEAHRQLAPAVRAVAGGGLWIPRDIISKFLDAMVNRPAAKGLSRLTKREREILELLRENLANKEIAARLNISLDTVKFHISNLLQKFGVQRRTDLILLCFQPTGLGV
jgi:DNA-binding NarL/FixJ family response regulator